MSESLDRAKFDEALAAYTEWCDREGIIFDQPSFDSSTESKGFIYLRNANSAMGRYSLKTEEWMPTLTGFN